MAQLVIDPNEDLTAVNSVGERLRLAREEKGISLEEVAKQTRIPIRHLEHIERGEWDAMPAITYSVGFARSYANAVGLDGTSVGAEVREQLGAGGRSVASGPASYYEPADPARVPPRWIAITAVIVAVLIVAGYLFWRSHAVGGSSDATEIVETAPPAAAPAAAPPPQAAPPTAVAANGPVVLTATEDVWLRISDGASPKALFQGILKAGEHYQVPADAQAPTVRTGRANVITVTVGGTAVPPLGPPEKTIANVSLRAADLAARAQAPIPTPPPSATR